MFDPNPKSSAVTRRTRRNRNGRGSAFRPELLERRVLLSTYTVTNVNDSGPGSLRQAILDANANAGADTVQFQIPGTGVHTITPTSGLPQVTGPVVFDVSQEPGYAGLPVIELDGTQAGASADGLLVSGGGSTITGLVINSFGGDGIRLLTKGNNVIRGNYVGTDAGGTSAMANGGDNIGVDGASNDTIGGTAAADRNVISGGAQTGIFVIGSGQDGNFNVTGGATGNVIEGNYIGTDVTGAQALGNAFPGVQIYQASRNTVGGTAPGTGNVISGGKQNGIDILGTGTTGNIVEGNYIGVDASGSAALPNAFTNLDIRQGAANNTIGGSTAAARNIISGGAEQGIGITGSNGNIVEGNYIGTDAAGTAAIPNVLGGIVIFNAANNNVIGGTAAGTGNLISGNANDGVILNGQAGGVTGNRVQGNFIGTNAAGNAALPNSGQGVHIGNGAGGNTIGGMTTAARNVISGNLRAGVFLESGSGSNNIVQGNYIGTNAAGDGVLGNQFSGVEIQGANQTIGGTAAGAGNLISGNLQSGIIVGGSSATGNRILGNRIGTNAAATGKLANALNGIDIQSPRNTIGGNAPGAANVISGNVMDGIVLGSLGGTTANGNIVQGNFIGTDPTATLDLGNGVDGVQIKGGADNLVGGPDAGDGNTIMFNSDDGVELESAAALPSLRDRILANDIFSNQKLGIDLDGDGVTQNTPGGPHSGTNNLQNFPVLTSATTTSSATTITGTLNSAPNGTFRVEIFCSPTADPSGYGQGQIYLGFVSVQTDASGNGSFTFTPKVLIPPGQVITATATDSANNTSEYSQAIPVINQITLQVTAASFAFSSSPHSLAFTFNEDVHSSLSDPTVLQVQNLTTGQAVTPASEAWDAKTDTATFTFAGVLPDGNYRATLPASSVTDSGGNHLAADYSYSFFFLSGDVNHDGKVDFKDLVALASHYGTPSGATFDQGDLNYDGAVDFKDLVILASNYGKSLTTVTAASVLRRAVHRAK